MHRVVLPATVLTALLALTGCGSGDDPDTDPSTSGSPARVEIVFEGEQAPPTERVEVPAGEEIELVIKSDEPGELHIHSDPEQEVEYEAGTTTQKITIDRPGVVDVERHDPEALVLQLEVS